MAILGLIGSSRQWWNTSQYLPYAALAIAGILVAALGRWMLTTLRSIDILGVKIDLVQKIDECEERIDDVSAQLAHVSLRITSLQAQLGADARSQSTAHASINLSAELLESAVQLEAKKRHDTMGASLIRDAPKIPEPQMTRRTIHKPPVTASSEEP